MTGQLDPEAQDILDVASAMGLPPISSLSVEQARERMRASLITKGAPLDLLRVEDVRVPTPSGVLPMRLYRPIDGVLPVVLFLRGGGWTINDLDTHDDLCRRLAVRSEWLFAALDFRRAPEHKYPAPLEDAFFAYRWLLDNSERIQCDPGCRAVVGESSGGTIGAGLTLLLRDAGAPMPSYQILAYPLTDRFGRWPSYTERGSGYTLDRELVKWFFDHYLPTDYDAADPYLFPLAARDLSGLPPTFVMTAEFDPLRDEGIAYAAKLEQAGVAVEHMHADDQMHGFLLQGRAVSKAGELVARISEALVSYRSENGPQRPHRSST
jgi:acetyl esterase